MFMPELLLVAMPSATPNEIEARLRAYRATANPDVLWPECDRSARQRALARIVQATREVLRGNPAQLACAAGEATAFGIAAFTSGMGPLLALWGARGALRTDAAAATLLDDHLAHARKRAARLERALLDIARRCEASAVPVACLKGAHTGWVYFPEPAARAGADLDLLVRPDDRDALAAILRELGYTPTEHQRHPERVVWMAPDASRRPVSLVINHADNPWSLDVHISLERFYFRGLRCALPWDTASWQPFTTAGCPISGLGQPLLFVYLALNASSNLHQLQLIRLVELVLVSRRDTADGGLSWAEVERLCTRAQAWRFVYPALALAADLAPDAVPPELVERARRAASPRARRTVAAIANSGAYELPRRSIEEKLIWARGTREMLLNLSELLWPSLDREPGMGRGALLVRRLRMLSAREAVWRSTRGARS